MSETSIEKRLPAPLKEKGQYALAFGVIAVMLYVAGFPVFLLFFVGVLTFFIWKVFSSERRNETRRIFEFYLSANEILRDDGRRWYGFEIKEAVERGEAIVRSMSAAPPLVYFALGALYQKLNDHDAAVKNLAHVVEESAVDESAIVYPTKELRDYVRILRKIERSPAEAPLTSSAIRSLERARKNRGHELLEYSRTQLASDVPSLPQHERKPNSVVDLTSFLDADVADGSTQASLQENQSASNAEPEKPIKFSDLLKRKNTRNQVPTGPPADRKTISEVLHDIYDKNVQ